MIKNEEKNSSIESTNPNFFKTPYQIMKRQISIVLVPVFLMLLVSSCLKTPPPQQQTCSYDPCSYKAPDSEVVRIQHYLDSTGITATKHCSGMFYKIDSAGTGQTPNVCFNSIIAKYKGTLVNGSVFDSGVFQQPIDFGHLIQGWANGIPLIKEGGKITLYIPPSLGYGPNQQGRIPGNSILIFDVSLLKVY
jgi:FKBP-type peptidyl-prolyl cis-trans isomerase FkpA